MQPRKLQRCDIHLCSSFAYSNHHSMPEQRTFDAVTPAAPSALPAGIVDQLKVNLDKDIAEASQVRQGKMGLHYNQMDADIFTFSGSISRA